MQLQYDEDLIEAAVLLCVSGRRPGASALQVRRFQRERDRLYLINDPDVRNTAFFRLHLEWFAEWGLERELRDIIRQFPQLENLHLLAFRKARFRNEEGAELYVNEAGPRHGLVALRPERFERSNHLVPFLNHEFQHLSDMLDPEFAYSPQMDLATAVTQQRLVRDRYRLLWDVTIDGRLLNAGRRTIAIREQRWAEFERAHAFLPQEKRQNIFESLWNGHSPRHQELLSFAADPRGIREARQPTPGAQCPLCGFPTFEWADAAELADEIAGRVHDEFPSWTQDQGICRRCVEMYQAAVSAAYS